MTALRELRERIDVYKEDFNRILSAEGVSDIAEYDFCQNVTYSNIDDLEVAIMSSGQLLAGYSKDKIFYLVTNLNETLFADRQIALDSEFTKHKEVFPKLGIDARKNISGSVVKLNDGRIVTMLNNGMILEK